MCPFASLEVIPIVCAAWCGLPCVTWLGTSYLTRWQASLAASALMSSYQAHNSKDYLRLASELASKPQALAQLRAENLQKRQQWPLFDASGYIKSLEKTYQQLWQQHQARR